METKSRTILRIIHYWKHAQIDTHCKLIGEYSNLIKNQPNNALAYFTRRNENRRAQAVLQIRQRQILRLIR